MAAPIEFYFDFSSPYGYMASTRIDALAAKYGREVRWHPFLLGAAFKVMGVPSMAVQPLKSDYSRRDFERSARLYGIPYQLPKDFPISALAPARAVTWALRSDSAKGKALTAALYRSYFVDGINIGDAANVVSIAAKAGFDAAAVEAGMADPVVKEALKTDVEAALAKGVFGSPFVIVDGEPFWGMDRLDQVERWLKEGPF